MSKKKEVKVYFDDELKEELRMLAESKNMTLSRFICDTMEKVYAINYLDKEIKEVKKHSDYLGTKIAELKTKMDNLD